MRKKPDTLLLLAVVVVSGVIISNFVVFNKDKKLTQLPHLNTVYSDQNQNDSANFKAQEVVRIDSSKQRNH